jgi:hypothetical protein
MRVSKFKIGLAVLAACLVVVLVLFVLNFSTLTGPIRLRGIELRVTRKVWLLDGSPQNPNLEKYIGRDPTNKYSRIFVFTNAYSIQGKEYESLFAIDTSDFNGEGTLVIAKDGTLIWLDKRKGPSIVHLPQRYK